MLLGGVREKIKTFVSRVKKKKDTPVHITRHKAILSLREEFSPVSRGSPTNLPQEGFFFTETTRTTKKNLEGVSFCAQDHKLYDHGIAKAHDQTFLTALNMSQNSYHSAELDSQN